MREVTAVEAVPERAGLPGAGHPVEVRPSPFGAAGNDGLGDRVDDGVQSQGFLPGRKRAVSSGGVVDGRGARREDGRDGQLGP